jgi:hypothetical protein
MENPAEEPQPTEGDYENERTRREIADRQEAAWLQCAAWAEQVFGSGFEPCCRHFLLDKLCDRSHNSSSVA